MLLLLVKQNVLSNRVIILDMKQTEQVGRPWSTWNREDKDRWKTGLSH